MNSASQTSRDTNLNVPLPSEVMDLGGRYKAINFANMFISKVFNLVMAQGAVTEDSGRLFRYIQRAQNIRSMDDYQTLISDYMKDTGENIKVTNDEM